MAAKDFLSYSRRDEDLAKMVWERLHSVYAIDLWMDIRDIRPGEQWDRAIHRALESAAQIVVIHTRSSFDSENVWDEWSFMLDDKKPVIPLNFARGVKLPYRLARCQHIDFSRLSFEAGIERLYQQLLRNRQPYFEIETEEAPVVEARRDP